MSKHVAILPPPLSAGQCSNHTTLWRQTRLYVKDPDKLRKNLRPFSQCEPETHAGI